MNGGLGRGKTKGLEVGREAPAPGAVGGVCGLDGGRMVGDAEDGGRGGRGGRKDEELGEGGGRADEVG